MMRRLTVRNGFTLIEILVVIAIVAVVGTMMVAIFIATLRGSNKSQILAVIKQNGQAVLEGMSNPVRGADNIYCGAGSATNTLVIEKAGAYTRYRFKPAVANSTNGMIEQDHPVPPDSDDLQQFLTDVCTQPMGIYTSGIEIITDTNSRTGVSVVNGSFVRSVMDGTKDSVRVSFELQPGVAAPAAVSGQIDPVDFQTTIQLR